MINGYISRGFHSVIKYFILCVPFFLFGCKPKGEDVDSNNIKKSYSGNAIEYPVIDEVTMLPVYLHLKDMPIYKDGKTPVTQDFSSLFEHRFEKDEVLQTTTVVVFVIDTTGALVGELV